MDRLKGKVSIVTGANSGIGKCTAELFAREGSDLVLVARRLDKLKEVEAYCAGLGVKVISVSADVSVYADCQRVVKEAIDTFGRIDVLVNNAGIADKHRPITRCDVDWFDYVVKVDQYSVYYMMKEVLPYMEKQNSGSIINISSIGGTTCNSGISYTAAKAAVVGMTKNVCIQYVGTGIRINSVAPGPTPTELNTPEQIATFDGEFAGKCAGYMNPLAPEVPAEEQANAILFFASDESKCITGQVLVVDNGSTMY